MTVSVTDMPFLRPVHVGNVVCGYTEMARVSTTSVTSHVEISALRGGHPPRTKVTSAGFKYVPLDEHERPTPIRRRA